MSERVSVVTKWLVAYTGWPLDRIILPREPATDQEREWVECELRTRLNPGGVIEVSDGKCVTNYPVSTTWCLTHQSFWSPFLPRCDDQA